MNKTTSLLKQFGFFDLGLSLILISIFGTTTAVVALNQESTAEPQIVCTDAQPDQTRCQK